MKSPVTLKFRHYLRQIRNRSGVTVRELAEAIGKSPGYVSQLERGQIKTISFETAQAILQYLNEKSLLITGTPEEKGEAKSYLRVVLEENFGIYPSDYLEKQLQEEQRKEQEYQQELEKIAEKMSRLSAVMTDARHLYILDFAIQITQVAGFMPPEKENLLKRDLGYILKRYHKKEFM